MTSSMPFADEIAVRTVWMEFRGESEDAQRAGFHVILNRFKTNKYKTLAGVCLRPYQFSSWNTQDVNRYEMSALPDDNALLVRLRTLLMLARQGDTDPTFGATMYYSTFMAQPPGWAVDGTCQETARIGHTVFLKEVTR